MWLIEFLLVLMLGFGGGESALLVLPERAIEEEINYQKPRIVRVPATWGEIKAKYKGGTVG